MKKILMCIIIILLISAIGCNNDKNTIYGEIKGNQYVNENIGFTMKVPKGWVFNDSIKMLNGKDNKYNELEEIFICMLNTSTNNSKVSRKNSSITIMGLNNEKTAKNYAKELYYFDFGDDSLNAQNMYNKDINGKEFLILEYINDRIYITEYGNRIIEIQVNEYTNNEEEINKSIDSIKFE